MTVISSKDLDAQMGKSIDPNSVPKHDGATKGVMQGQITNPSDDVVTDKGHGQRGSAIYNPNEIPQKGFYGSSTVISVNDAPPLDTGLEPKRPPMPALPPAPQQQVQQPKRPATAVEILARMGLKPKP